MEALYIAILLLVAIAGTGVVLTRDATCQVVGLSLFGITLAVMFTLFHAPDVALSQIVIGAVGLPLMILLTLAKLHRDELSAEENQKKDEDSQREMDQNHEEED